MEHLKECEDYDILSNEHSVLEHAFDYQREDVEFAGMANVKEVSNIIGFN